MYSINIGNKILYYPGNSDYTAYDLELNEEVGKVGELTAKIPVQNPLYASVVQGSILTILKDGIEYWRGETRELNNDIDNIADIYCLEDLTWLADEYLPPASITNETYAQRFQSVIETYNSTRPSDRQFAVGMITNVNGSDLCNWVSEYEWSILDCIRQNICKDTGYIRVRRVTTNGVVTRYIDVVRLEDYGTQATQPIEYGYNLLDYLKESDCQNLVNVLTPYGDELETEIYAGYSQRLQGTTITNNDSVALYGRHAKAVIFNGVTDLPTLNALAAAYLTRYSQPQITMEVKAVDLGDIENVGMFNVGDSVRIIATPFGIDQWLYHTQIKRDLQNVEKNVITLSGRVQQSTTLTSQTVDTVDMIKNLPSKSSILAEAKANALRILNGENGGVIYFVSNEDNQITEQIIANNLDINQATKAWRWNLNGLAYLHRTYPSDSWQVGVAITMDGAIVADYITTGTLNANLIKTGIISDYYGKFSLNMNTGAIVMNYAQLNNATVSGHIQASSGYIGSTTNGFIILDTAIFSVNGPSSVNNTWNIGAYYGVNGIRINANNKTTYVGGGSISCNGTFALGDASSLSTINGRFNNVNGYITQSTPDNTQFAFLHMSGSDVQRWVSWSSASDRRLKENIVPIEAKFVRDFFERLKPVKFNYISDETHKTEFGLIAQELEETFEEVEEPNNSIVFELEGDNAYKAINYERLVGLLIPAVKDLYAQIDELKEEIEILKEGKNG